MSTINLKQAAREFEAHLKIAVALKLRSVIQKSLEEFLEDVVARTKLTATITFRDMSGAPSANKTLITVRHGLELSARITVTWTGYGAEVLVFAMTDNYNIKRQLELTLDSSLGLVARSVAELILEAFEKLEVKEARRQK